MICILHGYLLEGSGSNLWTRAVLESLCRTGATVHLMAQENHPERYPFISQWRRYPPDGDVEVDDMPGGGYPGRCILHQPHIGDTLPVYVWDRYEEFGRVVPMVELSDGEIEDYLARNVEVLLRVVREQGITALHANHAVMMSEVARRVSEETGVPYAIMPHGSAIEYAVKRDERFLRMATGAFRSASRLFTIGAEMRTRVLDALPAAVGMEAKFSDLHLGVDTSQFEPISRGERPASIERLKETLRSVPRGRTAGQTDAMLARLGSAGTEAELVTALDAARGYPDKTPDADLEEKLGTVRWSSDPTLLFVGRLISTKGIHGVVAALPFLLRERPDLRLLVVGHGPLREPLEAMLWALRTGARDLLERIVARGRVLEGSPEGESEGAELSTAARYHEQLRAEDRFDEYIEAAQRFLTPDTVVFTGYLTHSELRHLFPCCDAAVFPCCDAAVFPSVVREAGPLVFLEALASGAFPLGTYFGGMRASIDSVAEALPAGAAEPMKLSADPDHTVADIVRNVPLALEMGDRHKDRLFTLARERYDWSSVSRKLARELEEM